MTFRRPLLAFLITLALSAAAFAQDFRLITIESPEGGTRDELILESLVILPERTIAMIRFDDEMCGVTVHAPGHQYAFWLRESKGPWTAEVRAVAGALTFDQDRGCVPEGSRIALDFPAIPPTVSAIDVVEGPGGEVDGLTMWTWRRIELR